MHLLLAMLLATTWVEVRSDSFVVKSPGGVEHAETVLTELETFYQIVGDQMFRDVRIPELPLEVLVLDRDEMRRVGSRSGENLNVNGYYQKGIDRDFIVLSSDLRGRGSTSVVYHELTHYLISRGMVDPPTWLNEGLAEYFGSSRIEGNRLAVGRVLQDKLDLLGRTPMLPFREMFAVDRTSSHYNETNKANVFYSEAWALTHFLMQGSYAERFYEYLGTLRERDASLSEFLSVDPRELERQLIAYLRNAISTRALVRLEGPVSVEIRDTRPISRAEVDVSVAELLLSMGRSEEALAYLESAGRDDTVARRVAYSRGILAWLGGDSAARDHFVDALMHPELASRAAFHLVQMRELNIPAVLATLERAAAGGTRESTVYWALSEIYLEKQRRVRDLAEIAASRHSPPPLPVTPRPRPPRPPEPVYGRYAIVEEQDIECEFWSSGDEQPRVRQLVRPYYPEALRSEALAGEVTMDVQISPEGDVAGVWLLSASPDVFGSLATGAVRGWKFDPVSAKIRVIVRFRPEPPPSGL